MSSAAIALDAFPYEPEVHRVCDYGGLQIFGKLSLPLFAWEQTGLTPLAATGFSSSEEGMVYSVQLRHDLRWSNGERLTAEHYVAGIRTIVGDPTNRFNNLLSDLAGFKEAREGQVDCLGAHAQDTETIIFKLRNRNVWFPALLCQPNVSPAHPDSTLTAGPYTLEHRDSSIFEIRKSNYFFGWPSNGIESLTFINYEDHVDRSSSIDDYLAGRIDVTCDTVMKYDQIDQFSSRRDFLMRRPALGMFITPGSTFAALSPMIKRMLHGLIDRRAISELLFGHARPIYGYCDLYDSTADSEPRTSNTSVQADITLAYEDFYPNRIVCDELANQLRSHGVNVTLLRADFGDWSVESDLRFSLQGGAPFGPLNYFKSDILRGLLDEPDFKLARILYSKYMSSTAGVANKAARLLDNLLSNSGLCIPIVAVPTPSLISEWINHHSVYSVGRAATHK